MSAGNMFEVLSYPDGRFEEYLGNASIVVSQNLSLGNWKDAPHHIDTS